MISFKFVLQQLADLGVEAGSPEGIAFVESLGLDADWLKPKVESTETKLTDTSAGINDGIPPRFIEGY